MGKVYINGTLTNCTCNYANGETVSAAKIFRITPNTGYEFVGTGYKINYATAVDKTLTVTNGALSYDFTGSGTGDYFVGNFSPSVKGFKVIFEGKLTNCTSNYANGELINKDKVLKIIPKTGYIFKGNDFFIEQLFEQQMTNVDGTLEFVFTMTNENAYVGDFSPSLDVKPPKVVYEGVFVNCSCNYADGEEIKANKQLTITAFNGYEFLRTFFYTVGIGFSVDMTNKGSYLVIEDYQLSQGDIILNSPEYVATEKVEKMSDFTNIYFVTSEELTQLSKARFQPLGSGIIDYGTFITDLYLLPFPVSNALLSSTKTDIILGNFVSGVKSTRMKTYKTIIDGGEITVNEKYNNVYDYLNTECILHLPFFDKIYINTEYVVNQTLSIKYIIDFYTGNVTCNIYTTFINGIIESQTQQIAENIPFIQKQNNSLIGSVSTINKNVIETAFIEIVRNIPYTSNNIFGRETVDFGVLGDYKGFIKCTDIVLESKATADEKAEIEQLLKQGVFINEN